MLSKFTLFCFLIEEAFIKSDPKTSNFGHKKKLKFVNRSIERIRINNPLKLEISFIINVWK